MVISRTINPIHFEDLEPHRFEDLVRQIIYDFKSWQTLEATGRAGADEGFDIRGIEIATNSDDSELDEENKGQDVADSENNRTWLIQCKREKTITPKKIKKYIDEIFSDVKERIYGVIFVAACDFSKATRDIFIKEIRKRDIEEFYIWGKAELEDMLFQPKNDHLLFAYFGVSLRIRDRSLKTRIRARITIKKKLISILGNVEQDHFKEILLRDINDKHYPDKEEIPDFKKKPKWLYRYFVGHYFEGIKIIAKDFYAYISDDGTKWDYFKGYGDPSPHNNPWGKEDEIGKKLSDYSYYRIPDKNKAHFRIIQPIPYERILAIDEHGDEYVRCPHLFLSFTVNGGPYDSGCWAKLTGFGTFGKTIYNPEIKNRIDFFPSTIPDISKEERDAWHSEYAKNLKKNNH